MKAEDYYNKTDSKGFPMSFNEKMNAYARQRVEEFAEAVKNKAQLQELSESQEFIIVDKSGIDKLKEEFIKKLEG